MGASGGGGQSPYEYFNTYTKKDYKEYTKKAKTTNSPIMSENEFNNIENNNAARGQVAFKKGTDMGAIKYLFKNKPNHELFQQGQGAQARRDAGGNDALMFNNQGKLDDASHNALYEGGAATNRESRAYKEGQEVMAGAAANKRNKAAAPIANAKGSKQTTGGTSAPGVQAASQPGSILGGISEAVKSLLGG